MKEAQLRPVMERYLQSFGYYVAHECMIYGHCDMIGCKWAERVGRAKPELLETVAVELKISDILGVISQAEQNLLACTYSFAAMPLQFCESMRPQSVEKFRLGGVGLYGIDVEKDIVKVIVPSLSIGTEHAQCHKDRLWNFYLRHRKDEK